MGLGFDSRDTVWQGAGDQAGMAFSPRLFFINFCLLELLTDGEG
jgi:hypothetical protein